MDVEGPDDPRCEEQAPAPVLQVVGNRRIIFATPGGDIRTVRIAATDDLAVTTPPPGTRPTGEDLIIETLPLADAVALADRPGDIVQLLAGRYWLPLACPEDPDQPPWPKPIELVGRRGDPDLPITIRGLGHKTILVGSNAVVPCYPHLPRRSHFSFFKLIDCEGIAIEAMSAETCWPCLVYAEDSRWITVRRVVAVDSLYLVFARGSGSHHYLVEDNHWQQDPTGALWDEIPWAETHGFRTAGLRKGSYRYYNGALFGSLDIAGSVIVRGNHARDAFNAIRMEVRDLADGEAGNRNVEICDNRFERIRDNPIEPEGHALNWFVHDNQFVNCHAWFSLDGVRGGFLYIFGNVGWFTERPGQFHDPNSGGKVFKFINRADLPAPPTPPPLPDRPIHVFNNSWFLRTWIAKSGLIRHFHHYNNAVQFCRPEDFPPCTCLPGRGIIEDLFDGGPWDPTVSFDHDLCSVEFAGQIATVVPPQESHGHGGSDPGFIDPRHGDFRLTGSPLPGRPIVLRAGQDWPDARDWMGGTETAPPPIGAFAGQDRFVGPPFVHLPAPPVERPRIVRVERARERLEVVFSVPLAPGQTIDATLVTPDGLAGKPMATHLDGRSMICELVGLPAAIDPATATVILSDRPLGVNGSPATLWGSADPRVRFGIVVNLGVAC